MEKFRAVFTFEWPAAEAAADFEFRSGHARLQRAQALFNFPHVRYTKCTQIDHGLSAVGDNIRTRAAFDDAGIDRNAAARVIPGSDSRDLHCKLVDRIHSFFRREARMRGAAVHGNFRLTDPLASSFETALGAERRL